ncbi:MAG: trigger factor [Planctomycetota bacterium]
MAEDDKKRYLSETEVVGPCKVEVKITVPVETIHEEYDARYEEIIKTVAFPGFRVGHTPRRLVEKKLGDEVEGDVKETLISESFKAAIEDHDLDPISDPDVDLEGLELSRETPLEYSATLLVRPTVELPDYTSIEVEAEKPEVTDEKIEAVVDAERKRHSLLEPVEDGEVEQSDIVVIDFTARVGDEKIAEKENEECAQMFPYVGGLPAKDFPETLLGKKVGAEFELTDTFPETWPDPDFAGKDFGIEVKLQDIKRYVLPEVDQEFVESLDYDSVEEFREEMQERVEQEAAQEAQGKTDEKIRDAVIAAAPFELPEDIIKEETSRRIDRLQAQLRMQGAGEEDVDQKIAEASNSAGDEVERDYRTAFLMDAIAKAEKIFVTESEIEERISQMASAYGRSYEEMEQYVEQRDMAGSIRAGMREEKVMEMLKKKVKISD